MALKQMINNTLVDMTAEEETAHLAMQKKMQDELEVEIANKEAKETEYNNLKASAKAKLVAGEALTEEEADTIVL